MTRWVVIRDKIIEILSGVEGVSVVHPYPRLAVDKQTSRWLTWMRDDAGINAWTICREKTSAIFLTCKQIRSYTTVGLIGMLQHNDDLATHDEFADIVDNVLSAFYKKTRLDVGQIDIQGPGFLRIEELRQVSNIPVHYAEIEISVEQTFHV